MSISVIIGLAHARGRVGAAWRARVGVGGTLSACERVCGAPRAKWADGAGRAVAKVPRVAETYSVVSAVALADGCCEGTAGFAGGTCP